MAIGSPFALGSTGASSVTTTVGAPISSTIFGTIFVVGTVSSISDGTANAYTLSGPVAFGGANFYSFRSVGIAHDVPLGSSIAASGSISSALSISVGAVAGAGSVDVLTIPVTGTSSSISASTGTLSRTAELVVALLCYGWTSGPPTFTEGASFAGLTNAVGSFAASRIATHAAPTAASVTYAPSASGASGLQTCVQLMTFEPASPVPLPAAEGAFALTGGAAGLLVGHKLAAAPGVFALTGEAAAVLAARIIPAGEGMVHLTGGPAMFTDGLTLSVSPGSFSLNGKAAGLRVARKIQAAPGTFGLTSNDAALVFGPKQWPVIPPVTDIWTPVAPNPDPWTPVVSNPDDWT